ncbi:MULTISPECIES: hypothetical protein [Alphaproteobacteria]|uniref:hypothetical protein n=1 Tax=Alphaproteobacteria TaxID=28211 RepID=UPI003A8D3489
MSVASLFKIGMGFKFILLADTGLTITEIAYDIDHKINGDKDPDITKLTEEYTKRGGELDHLNQITTQAQVDVGNLNNASNALISLGQSFTERASLVYEQVQALMTLREFLRAQLIQPDFAWYHSSALPNVSQYSPENQKELTEKIFKSLSNQRTPGADITVYALQTLSIATTPFLFTLISRKFPRHGPAPRPRVRHGTIRLNAADTAALRSAIRIQNRWYNRTGRYLKKAATSKWMAGGIVVLSFGFSLYNFINNRITERSTKNDIMKNLREAIDDIEKNKTVLSYMYYGANTSNGEGEQIEADQAKLNFLVKNLDAIKQEDITKETKPDDENVARTSLVNGFKFTVQQNNQVIRESTKKLEDAYKELIELIDVYLPDTDDPCAVVCPDMDHCGIATEINDAEQVRKAFKNFIEDKKHLDDPEKPSADRMRRCDNVADTFRAAVLSRLARINDRLEISINDIQIINRLTTRIIAALDRGETLESDREISRMARGFMRDIKDINCAKRTIFKTQDDAESLIRKIAVNTLATRALRAAVGKDFNADSNPSDQELAEKATHYLETVLINYPTRTILLDIDAVVETIDVMLIDLKAFDRLKKRTLHDFEGKPDPTEDEIEEKAILYLETLFEDLEDRSILKDENDIFNAIEDILFS